MNAADEYCDFGGLPRSMCAHCLTTAYQAAGSILERYASFPAGTGPCVTNGGPWSPSWFSQLWERHLAALENGITIQSQWRGRCQGCDREWDEGDDITWSGDESAWVCGRCARPG